MTQHRNLDRGDVLPASLLDALQEFISTMTAGFIVEKNPGSTTQIRVPAGTTDDQVGIGIDGRWRYITATVTATHPGGAAGVYDIYVTGSDNSFSNTPAPDTDNTVYAFALAITTSGGTPTGPPAIYRKVGTCAWDGAKITSVYQLPDCGGRLPDAAVFGDGSDGDVTIAVNTTLTRDMFYENLTINGGIVLSPDGYRIFVRNVLTNNGTIRFNGNNGAIAVGGAAAGSVANANGPRIYPASPTVPGAGGNGGNNSTGANASINLSFVPAGGNGGNGGTSGGANGGGIADAGASAAPFKTLNQMIEGFGYYGAAIAGSTYAFTPLYGGGGGGGGGGATGFGGGAGSGGGYLVVCARFLNNAGTIEANGGIGAAGTGTNGGGGGGGGGGVVNLIYGQLQARGTITANGGAGGAKVGTGVVGSAGSNGRINELAVGA